MRIAVLVSGHGSNLQALIDANLSGHIVGVLSNNPKAFALERAKQANIPTATIIHQDFPTRQNFDEQIHKQLLSWQVDLVILAGFMRILSSEFVQKWQGCMLNIHPSLLPVYKGTHTHQRVLNTGDRLHGCTVHFVSAELDAGQAIAQASLIVHPNDNLNTLTSRVHALEHFIYPIVVEWFCTGQLLWQDHCVKLNGKPLLNPICLTKC